MGGPGAQGQLRKALASASAPAEGGACKKWHMWRWMMRCPAYISFLTPKVSFWVCVRSLRQQCLAYTYFLTLTVNLSVRLCVYRLCLSAPGPAYSTLTFCLSVHDADHILGTQ